MVLFSGRASIVFFFPIFSPWLSINARRKSVSKKGEHGITKSKKRSRTKSLNIIFFSSANEISKIYFQIVWKWSHLIRKDGYNIAHFHGSREIARALNQEALKLFYFFFFSFLFGYSCNLWACRRHCVYFEDKTKVKKKVRNVNK